MLSKLLARQDLNFSEQNWTFRPQRVNVWRDFVGDVSDPILVLGLGEFEKRVWPDLRLVGTEGDYNYDKWKSEKSEKYQTVFCFEVIEHLCNPLLFLERIKLFLADDGDLFISWPSGRPQFLWTAGHFHEMGQNRAEKMFQMAGYTWDTENGWRWTPILWKKPLEYLKGVRPLLRLFFPLHCLLYHLKISEDK
jgi:hypothetical protein